MPNFRVHHRTHSRWYTFNVEAPTFGEAAIRAVVDNCKNLGLDLAKIAYEVQYSEREDGYASVIFREKSVRRVFRGVTTPGEFWFSDQVRQGAEDDCSRCAGTGIDFYNPFVQCGACGDRKLRGQSSGRKKPSETASAA